MKDAKTFTSPTVGVLLELCAVMIGQNPRELLLEVFHIERQYPLSQDGSVTSTCE